MSRVGTEDALCAMNRSAKTTYCAHRLSYRTPNACKSYIAEWVAYVSLCPPNLLPHVAQLVAMCRLYLP